MLQCLSRKKELEYVPFLRPLAYTLATVPDLTRTDLPCKNKLPRAQKWIASASVRVALVQNSIAGVI